MQAYDKDILHTKQKRGNSGLRLVPERRDRERAKPNAKERQRERGSKQANSLGYVEASRRDESGRGVLCCAMRVNMQSSTEREARDFRSCQSQVQVPFGQSSGCPTTAERQSRRGAGLALPVVMQRDTRERAEEVDLLRRRHGLHPVVSTKPRRAGHAGARDAAQARGGRDGYMHVLLLEVQRVRLAHLAEVDGVDAVRGGRHDLGGAWG